MKKVAKIALSLFGIFLFLCLCNILFDPLAPYINRKKMDDLQVEFNTAKAKWNSQNITDYSYDVEYFIPLIGVCGAQIIVKQGEIIGVTETINGGFDKLPTPIALSAPEWQHEYCDYSERLTIPNVFNRVQVLINANKTLDVIFNKEFGYVENYYGSENVGYALQNFIADSEFSYTFGNFQHLNNTTP